MFRNHIPKRWRAFQVFRQHDRMDCGPACLRMVSAHYGKHFSLPFLRQLSGMNRAGVSLLGLCEAAEDIGFKPTAAFATPEQLRRLPTPLIVWWNQNHFVVVYDVDAKYVRVADPGIGRVRYRHADFQRAWVAREGSHGGQGAILLLEPTPQFFATEDMGSEGHGPFHLLWSYVRQHPRLLRSALTTFALSLFAGALIPLLASTLVDDGVAFGDRPLIFAIGAAQIALYLGRLIFTVVQRLALVHLGGRVSLSILSHFLSKLLRMPVRFFETVQVGDVLTRVHDHLRIQGFMTSSIVHAPGSLIYAGVLGALTLAISPPLAAIIGVSSILILLSSLVLDKRRSALDRLRFDEESSSQTRLIDAVSGIRDLKLSGAEQRFRWDWERNRAKLFDVDMRRTNIEELQELVATSLTDLVGVSVSIYAALLVVNGQLTVGAMMAVLFVVGQITSPVRDLPAFIRELADVRLALERFNVISLAKDESASGSLVTIEDSGPHDISVESLCFRYGERGTPWVLDHVDLDIPAGSTCAIVGSSGSGKTTLISLLMKHFDPQEGQIFIGDTRLRDIDPRSWRKQCGAVLQDGHMFAGTIAENIAFGEENPDPQRVREAAETAFASEFIRNLPLGFQTRIGADGMTLSGGQTQRILIARAAYADPAYLFFDEATSALDARSEREVQDRLSRLFSGRTVFVVAHRLSTVRDADQIIVLEHGRVVEVGTHQALVRRRGPYYELVQNQLELAA